MNFKKMLNNPWLILGGAVAVYWFWIRPKSASAGVTTAPTPTGMSPQEAAARAATMSLIDDVTAVRPGETAQQTQSRYDAFSAQTGQPMPVINF